MSGNREPNDQESSGYFATLAAAEVKYDRSKISTGILHIGAGRFHRAHQALYCHELLEQGDHRWGISAAFILPSDGPTVAALREQKGLYTVCERDARGDRFKWVGSIVEVVDGYHDPGALIHRMADPNVMIISCTVTEAGYYFDPATNRLNLDHPAIASDLDNPQTPKTLYGFLASGLLRRQLTGGGAVTLQSCDNIQGNGDALRAGLFDFLQASKERDYSDLIPWLSEDVAFPNTMVDRITPAPSTEEVDRIRQKFGCEDRLAVTCEAYRQWVIEDRYSNQYPDWDSVGVQLVASVKPYEKTKIRLLNAGHSAIGYCGYLAGYETIADIVNNLQFKDYVTKFFREVEKTLPTIPNFDLSAYQHKLIERFANPAIVDQALRICKDGSVKIPSFILPTLNELLSCGYATKTLSFMLASYYYFLSQQFAKAGIKGIDDVSAEQLAVTVEQADGDMAHFLSDPQLFGGLVQHDVFVESCQKSLDTIVAKGILAAVPFDGM